MELQLFNDLVSSLKEAKKITHGESQPSRRFEVRLNRCQISERESGCHKANLPD
jgi:hypothetical protein